MNTVTCEFCKREIDVSKKREDGLPAAVAFELEDGTNIVMCTDCIMKKGNEVITFDDKKQ